jgi:merlin protein
MIFLTYLNFRGFCLEKQKHLQHQLRELRTEIAVLKVADKQTEFDQLHSEQVKLGENKYSTLKKSKSGSTKSRVAFFEEL